MEGTEHTIGLGKIIGNLHSLELLLRVFLCEKNRENLDFPESSTGVVQETHLTNFMSLGNLIDAYNATLAPLEEIFSIDRSVVKIRDAIAHGRLTSLATTFPLTLHKFGKPKAGVVTIELVEVISEKWLSENRQLIFDQMGKIQRCARARNYHSL
ncbi:MAG TPA: hypothetical protein VIE66_13010 [Methylocella sp.]|jgi:hypothetical protein